MAQDQDRKTGQHTACDRHRAMAAASPTQPDLAYLAVRCLPPGPERDEGFLAGHRRWPSSAWFANAAGAVEGERGHYEEALADYTVAIKASPVLRQVVPVEATRLERLLHPESAQARQRAYARQSPILANMLQLEPGTARAEGPYRALAMLANGQLDEAVKAAARTPMAGHVLRLAAASEGASAALKAQAARLAPSDGVDDDTVWLALAAGARADDPAIASVLQRLNRNYDSPGAIEKIERFLALSRASDVAGAERMLDGVPVALRGQAFVAGAYLLGDRTPEAWRSYARSVLFSAERPYMG